MFSFPCSFVFLSMFPRLFNYFSICSCVYECFLYLDFNFHLFTLWPFFITCSLIYSVSFRVVSVFSCAQCLHFHLSCLLHLSFALHLCSLLVLCSPIPTCLLLYSSCLVVTVSTSTCLFTCAFSTWTDSGHCLCSFVLMKAFFTLVHKFTPFRFV